ncbi:hypothetical protein [Kitasatospora griseola]|uniref:hypothetical protein n=1 Tax=Kitasatospora griseola TaxID=2064 RepID=UPI0038171C1A
MLEFEGFIAALRSRSAALAELTREQVGNLAEIMAGHLALADRHSIGVFHGRTTPVPSSLTLAVGKVGADDWAPYLARQPRYQVVDFEHLHLMTPEALRVIGPLVNATLTDQA